MKISNNYILVERLHEEKKEGFETVKVEDSFRHKGKVKLLPEQPVYIGNEHVQIGDTILFKKNSPDTFEYEKDKLVMVTDILAVL